MTDQEKPAEPKPAEARRKHWGGCAELPAPCPRQPR